MADDDGMKVLDELLDTLEQRSASERANGGADAIDAVLNGSARETKVTSLRDAPEVATFREALTDGLIRADTANQLLRLVNELVLRWSR